MNLHGGPDARWPAKARHLAAAAAAGLPVPPGVVLAFEEVGTPTGQDALRELIARGPVIARAALVGEDEDERSAAGLGVSLGPLATPAETTAAIAEIARRRGDPWLVAYRGAPHPADRVIVQSYRAARWLLAAAIPPGSDPIYVEVHEPARDALASGASPAFAGSLQRWGETKVRAAVEHIAANLGPFRASPHGLDLELVVGPDDTVELVQLRPLTRPLVPGWPEFLAAVTDAGQASRLEGHLTLDAEHNPAPLSVIHAWLMGWLAKQRPHAGQPTVLAGWLYVKTLPRALSGASRPSRSAKETLTLLHRELIPRARADLERLEERLRDTTGQRLAACFDASLDLFLGMIDTYLGVVVPARSATRSSKASHSTPLCLAGREAFVDVLPLAWDLASPPLGAALAAPSSTPALALEDLHEAVASTLLGEWDDHLFALGLAPVRAALLRCGTVLGLGDDVFLLEGDELVAWLREGEVVGPNVLEERRLRQQRWATLRPPLHLEDGHPAPTRPARHLRGLPMGPSFEGPIAQRASLEALLRDPPSHGAIVVLPALSAQAALALQALGVQAVCCEYGGAMSHAALMSRELGLSALIGCQGCSDLAEGTRARLDTTLGRLFLRSNLP